MKHAQANKKKITYAQKYILLPNDEETMQNETKPNQTEENRPKCNVHRVLFFALFSNV